MIANFIRSEDPDEDGDSVLSAEEMNVPNHAGPGFGDGNGDGVMDHLQAYIASPRWPQTAVYHTIDTSESGSQTGGILDSVAVVAEPKNRSCERPGLRLPLWRPELQSGPAVTGSHTLESNPTSWTKISTGIPVPDGPPRDRQLVHPVGPAQSTHLVYTKTNWRL